MYKKYCGRGSCAECKKKCAVDENIPCSPDCENLDGKKIRISKCLKARCEEVFYIFGMESPKTASEWDTASEKLIKEYGETAVYPYD